MKRGMLILTVATLSSGCVAPGVQFTRTYCHRVQQAERLEAMTFESSFEARGLRDQQLLLEVQLLNRRGRLVRSADDRYRARSGAVAVGKTFMVATDPHPFENVRLTLPASQMHLREEDFPVRARFVVSDVDGKQLAVALARLPVERVEETYPPSVGENPSSPAPPGPTPNPAEERPPPAPEPPPAAEPTAGAAPAPAEEPTSDPAPEASAPPAGDHAPADEPQERPAPAPKPETRRSRSPLSADRQWFLPPADAAWPVLRGPYDSGSALLDQAYAESVSPVPLKPADRVWFVPVKMTGEAEGRLLLGPCATEQDAEAVAVRYHEMSERSENPVEVQAPIALPLSHGLAQQAAGPKDTLVTAPD